jgi:hypothetical protein
MGSQADDKMRDEAKLRVFYDLLSRYYPGAGNYSDFNAGILRAQIWKTMEIYDMNMDFNLPIQLGVVDRVMKLYLQLENKINRTITGNSWQVFHGTSDEPGLFEQYNQMLYPSN